MPAFHDLAVSALEPITADAIAITLQVPDGLREAYAFKPGQHLTFRTNFAGVEERRSYSICITPDNALALAGQLQVGVKLLTGGTFSEHVHDQLAVGDTLTTMTPAGRFGQRRTGSDGSRYVAVVAGSGITPMMSIMPTILATEPHSEFVLIFGNRHSGSVMFAGEIADLKDRYPTRFQIFHILSREDHQSPLLSGRIDKAKLETLLELNPPAQVADWFLCGPNELVNLTRGMLTESGVGKRQIHAELFFTGDPPPVNRGATASSVTSTITARLDGRTTTFEMPAEGSILDAVLAARPDAPFACKGGVCGTCRVRLIEGEVEMTRNFALDPEDLEAGFRLACQSVPITQNVIIDFDS